MIESTVSESENEARWQADNIIRIENSMLQFFQPAEDKQRIVTGAILRGDREYLQHELESRHFFEETMDPLSNMVGLGVRHFQSTLVRDLVSAGPDTTRSIRIDDLRWHASMLTNASLINARFRIDPFPHNQPSNLGAMPWGGCVPDDFVLKKQP